MLVIGSPPAPACEAAWPAGVKVDGTLPRSDHGTVPADSVPTVVMLLVPAQVESAVFSTADRPTLVLLIESQLGSL